MTREEDITDAFMRGYQAYAVQGGDAEMDNCQAQAPQNYMQQSRHNDGTDLISRADAIEAVRKCVVESELLADWNKAMESAQELLSALPSADAVQGEWEKTKLKDDMWICSACGSPLTTDDISEIHFCPNCGARMKGRKGASDEVDTMQ